jgi:hypothetical protein
VQMAFVKRGTAPYCPGGQAEQTPAPPVLKVPAAQSTAVGSVEPAGHAYPAAQAPLQVDSVAPVVDPYVPGSQGPLQSCVCKPEAFPNRPTGQSTHTAFALYCPTPHITGVEDTEPAGQEYPAAQGPVQEELASPAEDPYLPAGQSVHTPAAPALYLPARQMTTVELVLPSGQAYPGRQGPLHRLEATP